MHASPEQRQRAIAALERGHSVTAAAAKAGVTRECLHRWLREDHAYRDARGRGQAALEDAVLADALADGKLGLAVLRTRYRSWQERTRTELDVRDRTSDEDPLARAARLRSLAAALESAVDTGGVRIEDDT